MIDTIIMGTGNSRGIRSVPNLRTLAPTYDKLLELLTSEEGLPVDLLGPNPLGCEVVGTPLNKRALLSDATETSIWGNAENRTIDETLAKLNEKATVITGSYTGTGSRTTLYFPFSPKFFLVTGKTHIYINQAATAFGYSVPLAGSGIVIGSLGSSSTVAQSNVNAVKITDNSVSIILTGLVKESLVYVYTAIG